MAETIIDQSSPEVLEHIRVRKLRQEDLPALEWEGEFTHFRNVYQGVYQRTQTGNAAAWVALSQENTVIGQVFLQLDSERPEWANGWSRAYLYSFRIKPGYRNIGLGAKMVEVVESYLTGCHFSRLTLNVARENADAIRFYKRLGFHIVAEEPGIWSYVDHLNKWHTVEEPSWRMEKILR